MLCCKTTSAGPSAKKAFFGFSCLADTGQLELSTESLM